MDLVDLEKDLEEADSEASAVDDPLEELSAEFPPDDATVSEEDASEDPPEEPSFEPSPEDVTFLRTLQRDKVTRNKGRARQE